VIAHLARMIEETLLAQHVIFSFGRLEVSRERCLRVDHDVAAARQAHHHIGPQPTLLALHARLLYEIAVLEHPGHLNDPAQLELAPPPPCRRLAQSFHQIRGLAAQVSLPFGKRADLGSKSLICPLSDFSTSWMRPSSFSSDSFTGATSS